MNIVEILAWIYAIGAVSTGAVVWRLSGPLKHRKKLTLCYAVLWPILLLDAISST